MTPTITTPVVGDDLRVEIPVHDMGGSPVVRVDYAVGTGAPGAGSHLWRTAGTAESPSSVFTPVQLLGSTVWIRASGRSVTGLQLSTYTTPVYVEVADHARFTSLTFELSDNRVPVIRWDPNALAQGVRIDWVVHPADDTAGTYTDSIEIEAVYGELELPETLDIDQAVTVSVEAWDSFDSGVAGHLGETTTKTLVRRAITTELDALYLRSPDGGRWKVTVNNSGELVTEVVS